MIVMKYWGFSVGEIFFSHPGSLAGLDLMRFRQVESASGLVAVEEQSTLMLDLSLAIDDLFAGVDKGARYEIRRAEGKDGVTCRLFSSPEISDRQLQQLFDAYRQFATARGIAGLNMQRLSLLRQAGSLFIGEAFCPNGNSLACHVYLLTNGRARLLYSFSSMWNSSESKERALVGRANRLLHWNDVCSFKAQGCTWYDFGGFYRGNEDSSKLRINQFKADFGGVLRVDYNGLRACSSKGRVALLGYCSLNWFRRTATRLLRKFRR